MQSKANNGGGATNNANLEKTIQRWVELDNELKILNEQVKELRTRKNDTEDKIIDFRVFRKVSGRYYFKPKSGETNHGIY